MGAVRIMARDLVRTRNYITKFIVLRSHLNAVALKLQTVKSHEAMASAMKNVTGAMIRMNKTVNVPAMQKIMADPSMQQAMQQSKEYVSELAKDPKRLEQVQAQMEGLLGGVKA